MTVIARRFAIVCLVMGLFAAGLTMVVENGSRRGQASVMELSAPCPQPSGVHCRASL
jgi:hypothetical protein